MSTRYQRPGALTKNVFNRVVAFLVRRGVNVWGSRVLSVRGRKSGEVRSTPVNLMVHDGDHYLVAPRGHTQWVRNLRVAGEGTLRLGRVEQPFTAVEVADEVKPDLLRAYLKRWKFEVGVFFDGVDDASPDDELRRIAPDHPAFKLVLS
jgi:deazaflavin-dependent oxidoreductase (nitroreductase family)